MTLGGLLGKTLRLAVPLYLSTLLLALIPTGVMMLGIGTMAGDRPWRADLLGPGWMNLALDVVMEAFYRRAAPGLSLVLIGSLLLLPLAMLLQVVAYSFLAGGILEALSPAREDRLSYWEACARWFWPFFRLSLLGGIIVALVSVAVGALAALTPGVIGPDISTILQLAAQAVMLGWLELVRAIMVVRSTRSVGEALWQATRIAGRPVVLLAWLLLGLPSGGLLLAAILPPAVTNPYAPADLIVALLYGQVVAFLGAWTRVIRLAVAARFAQAAVTSRPAAALSAPTVRAG
jgi:hypothetical protein